MRFSLFAVSTVAASAQAIYTKEFQDSFADFLWAELEEGEVDRDEILAMAQDFANELDEQQRLSQMVAEEEDGDSFAAVECDAEAATDKNEAAKLAQNVAGKVTETGKECFAGICKGCSDAFSGLCKNCSSGANSLWKAAGDACSKGMEFCKNCATVGLDKMAKGAQSMADSASKGLKGCTKIPGKLITAGTQWLKDHKFFAQIEAREQELA